MGGVFGLRAVQLELKLRLPMILKQFLRSAEKKVVKLTLSLSATAVVCAKLC